MIDTAAQERWTARILRDRTGLGWQVSCVSARMKSGRIEAVHCAMGPGGRKLAVKQCAHPRKAIKEFVALQSLSSVSRDCVKPAFLIDEASMFAMEWIDAPTLKQMMHKPARLDLIARAGRWLRNLHSSTKTRAPSRDPQIEGALLVDPEGAASRRVDDRLRARRRRLGLRWLLQSRLHSDFHMGNLFVVEGRPVAFDPLAERRGMPMFDLADFLVLSEIYRLHAETGGTAWPDCARRDRQIFLDGYGPITARQERLLSFAMDLKIARMWHHHAKSNHHNPLEQAEFALLKHSMHERGLLDATD